MLKRKLSPNDEELEIPPSELLHKCSRFGADLTLSHQYDFLQMVKLSIDRAWLRCSCQEFKDGATVYLG